MILGMVEEKVEPASFGGEASQQFLLARALYAAHFGKRHLMAASGGAGSAAAGPVISQSEGGVSQTFANVSGSSGSGSAGSDLGTTMYGRMFADLVRVSPGRAGFVT
jgi:hypothetical protein